MCFLFSWPLIHIVKKGLRPECPIRSGASPGPASNDSLETHLSPINDPATRSDVSHAICVSWRTKWLPGYHPREVGPFTLQQFSANIKEIDWSIIETRQSWLKIALCADNTQKKEGFSLKKIYSISLILGSILGGHNLAWSQYATVEVTNGEVIQGHVTFAGEAPAPRILQVSQSPEVCGKSTLYDESLIVSSESQGLTYHHPRWWLSRLVLYLVSSHP